MAATVTAAVRRATSLPLIIKLSPNVTDIVVMAKAVEEAGADAVSLINTLIGMAINPQTRKPRLANVIGGLSGPAIKPVALRMVWQVASAVSIPVIGNGDILSYEDSLAMRGETGCDGVMIGRGALGNPWVFSPSGRPETLRGRLPLLRRHIELAREHLPVQKMLFRIKNHLARYLTGLPGASRMRQEIMAGKDLDDLCLFIDNLT
jgi:tRNA-dihydrouridine synthase